MSRRFEFRFTHILGALLILAVVVAVIWFFYFIIGAPGFDKETATTIHDSIIQGISGLGSVAIAVIIFRIQSLENRSHELEHSTLNYISQTMGWSYPEWTPSLAEDIRNKTLTNRYYARLPAKTDEFVLAEKERQQKRLEEALDLHDRIRQTIRRIRGDVFCSALFLILPILLSLVLLMVVDLLSVFWNFVFLVVVVLMCAVGILSLIKMVLESNVKD